MPNSPVFIISRIILPARFAIAMELAIIRIANGADDITEFYSILPLLIEFFQFQFYDQNFMVVFIFILYLWNFTVKLASNMHEIKR